MQQDEAGFQSTRGDVEVFLRELIYILNSKNYSFILLDREDKEEEYTNRYCKEQLDYYNEDVIGELKSLKVSNYYRTVKDENNKIYNEYYYEFGKIIKNRMVYIKVKIVSRDNKQVLCMSFHFPEFEMTRFPYK